MLTKILMIAVILIGAAYVFRLLGPRRGDGAPRPPDAEAQRRIAVEDLIECPRCGRWHPPDQLCACRDKTHQKADASHDA